MTVAGKAIEDWLVKEERTVTWLAKKLGAAQSTAHRWVHDGMAPSELHALALVKLTGIRRLKPGSYAWRKLAS